MSNKKTNFCEKHFNNSNDFEKDQTNCAKFSKNVQIIENFDQHSNKIKNKERRKAKLFSNIEINFYVKRFSHVLKKIILFLIN